MPSLILYYLCIFFDCVGRVCWLVSQFLALVWIDHSWCKPRQPTAEHVERLLATHRTALEILKKIGECCVKESQSWLSHVQALIKSKAEEEKTMAKEEQKEKKRVELAEQRKKDKLQKAEAKAKAAKAAQDAAKKEDAEEKEEDTDSKKRRNRQRSGCNEVEESEPELLREMFKLSRGAIGVCKSVPEFVKTICETPGISCLARLNRGPFKKVLSDSWR